MNYITEIKAFYDLVEMKGLSTGQIALWHGLMHINNKCGWLEAFTVSNQRLELLTGLSRKAIYNNRNVLKQLGVLEFHSNGVKATTYMLNNTQHSTQPTTQVSTQPSTQGSATLTKRKRKPKPKLKSISNDIPKVLQPQGEGETPLDRAIMDFVDYRKGLKKPMNDKALALLRSSLDKLSADDEGKIAILEQSILSGWTGVFPLRNTTITSGQKGEGNVFLDLMNQEET